MDIQAIITKAVKELSENEALIKAFRENPAKVIEKLVGIDLPDDKVNAVVKGVEAKLGLDNVLEMADKLSGFKGLFGK